MDPEPLAPEVAALGWLGQDAEERATATAICGAIDAFARASLDSAKSDRDGVLPERTLQGAKELGLFGLSIPVRYGGAGLSLHALCSVIERLTRHDRAIATTVGLHVGLGVCGLVDLGTDRLKDAWLPQLASGACLAAFAATEAMAGSDIASVGTTAVADGDALRMNGSKAYITNGGLAGVFTVLARTPGLAGSPRGHSMLLVERDRAGFSVGFEERKLGLRGSSTTPLSFQDVRVPLDHVIGKPGRGLEQLAHVLARGRTVMAAGCCGVAQTALDRTLVQVTSRSQFGRKIGSFDVVRAQVSEMAAWHFMMVALVRHACRAAADPDALTRRSLAAKVLCSEGAWALCDSAVQLHGASGYMEDTGLPLLLRDSRVMRIFEGPNDVLLAQAGTIEATAHRPRRALRSQVPSSAGELAARSDRLEDELSGLRARLLDAHGAGLCLQQLLLHRLGRAAICCEAADSAVLRAASQGDPRSQRLASAWLGLAEANVRSAADAPPDKEELLSLTEALYDEARA